MSVDHEAMKPDKEWRWQEIQRLSSEVANKPGVPTELESALCGAVVRCRDLAAQLEALKDRYFALEAGYTRCKAALEAVKKETKG